MFTTTYIPTIYPHRWLPPEVELETWEQIEPWYRKLLARPVGSGQELETWLLDMGELNGAVGQVRGRRHLAMVSQTDDPQRETSYLAFVREIEPQLNPLLNELRARYLDSPYRLVLSRDRYRVFDRALENRRLLFRPTNLPREAKLADLEQEYQRIIGGMTVSYHGKEHTLPQMAPFLEHTDRTIRQQAWELCAARRLVDRDRLDDLFDRMLKIRVEIAREAGFECFTDYAYLNRERFDYSIEDIKLLHSTIEHVVVPMVKDLHEARRQKIGVETLRPWDLVVDPSKELYLRPFSSSDELAKGIRSIFADIDSEFGEQYDYLYSHGLLDLGNRQGKAPGAFQSTLEDDRLPFVFMNAVGIDSDVRTALHLGGYGFLTLACRDEPLSAYRESPLEFTGVPAMAMELLGSRRLDRFYIPADADRSYQRLLEGIVLILPWLAIVDAFQHWIYEHPSHSRDDRKRAWVGLLDRFGGLEDYSGHEEAKEVSWHRQLHIFLYPFYYIEYAIGQIGALQVWRNSLRNHRGAMVALRRAMSLGGAKPLPELFETAGIRFDFGEETLKPLVDLIEEELYRVGS